MALLCWHLVMTAPPPSMSHSQHISVFWTGGGGASFTTAYNLFCFKHFHIVFGIPAVAFCDFSRAALPSQARAVGRIAAVPAGAADVAGPRAAGVRRAGDRHPGAAEDGHLRRPAPRPGLLLRPKRPPPPPQGTAMPRTGQGPAWKLSGSPALPNSPSSEVGKAPGTGHRHG